MYLRSGGGFAVLTNTPVLLLEEPPELTSNCALASVDSAARLPYASSKKTNQRIFISRFSLLNHT
jgi:hypothetical protein